MPAAIETDELTKDYLVGFWRPRPYRALDALTLQVEPGEVFGFLGPNGAGKSTTLKLLMQLIYPSSGSAKILGRPVGDLEVRRRIGFLAENPYYYDYLTAEEVLAYFARLFGYSGGEVRKRVAHVLDEVGMAGQRRMRLRLLSKGLLQRVGLAQALINDPEVVFLDEPMSGPRSARPAPGARSDPQAARAGLHGVLQLAHPVGRRIAVQPGRDHGARAAGRERPGQRPGRVRAEGLGTGRRGPQRRRGARAGGPARGASRRSRTDASRSICLRTRSRSA